MEWIKSKVSTIMKNDEEKLLEDELNNLGLTKDDVAYIMQQGEKFLEKPDLLAKKLKIELYQAQEAMDQLKAYMKEKISRGIKEFKKLVKEHPNETLEDIALLHDIPEDVVTAYLAYSEEKSLTKTQKLTIKEKYNAGFSIREIANQLQVTEMKIKEYVENNFLTFEGKGKIILDIIYKNFEEFPMVKLRQMIINKNIKLQEQICCELPKINEKEYKDLKRYFMKFEESENFLKIERTLSIEAKACIRASSMDKIGELSNKLNLMKVVIRDYLLQYYPDKPLILHFEQEQSKQIQKLESDFGLDTLISHTTYRIIITDSFENLIKDAKDLKVSPKKILENLLPLAFYYIKCSLPLEEFTQIIATITNRPLTTLDVFHLIFQMSDPVVRGLCIDHYSFSNPIPFYYQKLEPSCKKKKDRRLKKICKELWYSVQQFNGLVSFGIGWASWNPIGKSHLLDLMFETDFVKGSPQNSAFHFNSIDIQMTKNLFGEKEKTSNESTQWAYIDCHGCPDYNVIGCICQNLDIALIHVSHSDFKENNIRLEQDLNTMKTKHVYLLIRDYTGGDIDTKQLPLSSGKTYTAIFIPNLDQHNIQLLPVLKNIGYQIVHSSVGSTRLVGSNFLENLIMENDRAETLNKEKELIDMICRHICTNRSELNYSFLSYYPHFVEYMRYYYEATNETNQKAIDQLNLKREQLAKQLNGAKMNDIVFQFNKILSMKNSSLILWKLSQELKTLPQRPISVGVGTTNTEKYTLEILWREALLSNKYNFKAKTGSDCFAKEFSSNFSKHVEKGEPFELIDGDNLRFFNQEIDALLSDFYEKQSQEIITINKNKKRAPIVISIFGPQSSGKSTLLNYCFGCKFLTSAGRCTKGVYGSLSKLSQPINHSDHFLILDTEGLDAIEKAQTLQDTSCIHFDRTMVLFCLAVSQVIIINVKGDIGEEMRNLLQICAYSLNKLKVSKVTAPKIFFVLNQQADPDPEKHLNSINTLLEKLNKESYLMETEGTVISDLIQVSRKNLFVLPSAFNSKCVNSQMAKLFDSDLFKLSPTVSFANKCTNLRMSIIHELEKVRSDDEAPFTTVSEWMEMSGVIWDTIVKYQDIVKYRNVEELKCSITLRAIVSDLLKDKIYLNKGQYRDVTEKLIVQIKDITKWSPSKVILEEVKQELDKVFEKYQNEALTDFAAKCKDDSLLRKLNYMCDEAKKDLWRLIYMEKKICEDKLKFEIKARLTEIKLSENMMKFQEAIEKNADEYFELAIEQQKSEFEKVWADCFVNEKIVEEDDELYDILYDLDSKFRMESKTMENIDTIYTLFSISNFNINMILKLGEEMLSQFSKEPDKVAETDQFIYPWKENKVPLKEMTPYTGKVQCEYLSKDTLWLSTEVQNKERDRTPIPDLKFREWVPPNCHSLVQYCSGYYNHPDIIWNPAKRKQILLLASQLRNPNDIKKSTWEKLINDISIQVQEFIEKDPNISHSTVKEIVNHLCHICKVVNYEINYIEAKLTNAAERKISTFAFAITFKSLLETKTEKQRKDKSNENENKEKNGEYFLQKVENRKIARGNWDRNKMRKGDRKIANKFADDLLAAIWRSIKTTCEQTINEEYFNAKRDTFSHKSILHQANKKISEELDKHYRYGPIPEDNFVIQYICDRTECLKRLFREEWLKVAKEFQPRIVGKMKIKFEEQINPIKCVLTDLLTGLVAECSRLKRPEEIGLYSDSNFVDAGGEKSTEASACNSDSKTKEAPFKAMVLFLKMYLNPKVSSDIFNKFFSDIFEIDGINMKKNPETYVLFEKPCNPPNVLDEELFKRLSSTNMFQSTETIFNIKFYVEQFLDTLNRYEFKVTQAQYIKILETTKDNFETCVINCPYRCPSCGKFCEKEIHPHGEKCQIMTGHQICSMGGNVWKDQDRTAILLMCEDYKDDTKVLIPGQNMKWGEFKEKTGNEWDWSLSTDPNFATLQEENRKTMIKIWKKFGEEILQYYAKKGKPIKYIPYTTTREICESLFTPNYYVCFVIDGTDLMRRSIKYVKKWVLTLMRDSEGISYFKVIVYHGHGCEGTCVEKFPDNSEFTSDESIENFLENITTYSGEEEQLAMLDGLATATTGSDWKTDYGVWNRIVHFYVEPTKGYFNVFTATGECKHGCPFDWKRDINDRMDTLNIKYSSKRLINRTHPNFEDDSSTYINDQTTAGIDLNSGKISGNKSGFFMDYKTND